MFLKKITLFFIIILPLLGKAQDAIKGTFTRSDDQTSINFNEINDEITSADYENSNKYWHFYKINAHDGDKLYISLESDDYAVKMELYDSKNQFIGQATDTFDFDYESSLEIVQPVTYDDEYVLGVSSADEFETGKYDLKVAIASPQSISFSGNDICDKISFLIKQKAADYAFIMGDKLTDDYNDSDYSDDYSSDIKLFDLGDAFFSSDDLLGTEYVQNGIYQNNDFDNVKSAFDKYSAQLQNCIPSGWTVKMDTTTHGLPEFTAAESDYSFDYLSLMITKDDYSDLYSLDFSY
jgi:hypothetical protein